MTFSTLQSLGKGFFAQPIINSLLALEDITCRINFCNIPVGRLFIFYFCIYPMKQLFSHPNSLAVVIFANQRFELLGGWLTFSCAVPLPTHTFTDIMNLFWVAVFEVTNYLSSLVSESVSGAVSVNVKCWSKTKGLVGCQQRKLSLKFQVLVLMLFHTFIHLLPNPGFFISVSGTSTVAYISNRSFTFSIIK